MRFLAESGRLAAIIGMAAGAGFGVLVVMDKLRLLGKGPEILVGFLVAAGVGVAMMRTFKSRPASMQPPEP